MSAAMYNFHYNVFTCSVNTLNVFVEDNYLTSDTSDVHLRGFFISIFWDLNFIHVYFLSQHILLTLPFVNCLDSLYICLHEHIKHLIRIQVCFQDTGCSPFPYPSEISCKIYNPQWQYQKFYTDYTYIL